MSRRAATLIGFTAVLMWALLAFLSKSAEGLPPFQLIALSFFVGGLVGFAGFPFRTGAWGALASQSWKVWTLNVGALFGCHFLYFTAVRHAPIIEVSLLAYLWPLLIVLFSALMPGSRLKAHHLAGGLLGFVGAVLVIGRGQGLAFLGDLKLGHLIAIPYAVLWAAFSVSIQRFARVPTDVVAGFCLACAALSGLAHLALEETVWRLDVWQWAAVVALGMMPMGAAFYAWDHGMKHGDVTVLGACAYAAPLLSTLVLIATGLSTFHWSVAAACILITLGALLAGKDMFLRNSVASGATS